MKLVLKIALLALLIHFVPKFCHDKTDGFKVTNIRTYLPYHAEWETEGTFPKELFGQKFFYLGSGGQAYAFVSEDGQVVLKFFKMHSRRLPPLLSKLPFPGKGKQLAKRNKKLQRDFGSYKIAYDALPKETGILYVHLNQTNHLKTPVTIVDKLHIEHTLELDQLPFVLQKKGELALPYFQTLMRKGQLEEAKEAIDSICSLIKRRCALGIFDEDAKIHRNVGFLENRAFVIDVGRLKWDERRKDPKVQSVDLQKAMLPLLDAFSELFPELATHIEEVLLCENSS